MTVEHRNEQASIPRVPWRIVLVEDNPEDIVLLREVIHDENLPVELQIFPDGESALSLINALEEDPRTPRPHLFLIDLNLPKADGFMLLRQIRNRAAICVTESFGMCVRRGWQRIPHTSASRSPKNS